MKKIPFLLFLFVFFSLISVSFASSLIIDNDVGVNVIVNVGFGRESFLAQTIQVPLNTTVSAVQFPISFINETGGQINLRIETNNVGEPSGTLVHSSCDVNIASFTVPLYSDYEWFDFNFLGNDCVLSADTNYFLVLNSGSSNNTGAYLQYYDNTAPYYGESFGSRFLYTLDAGNSFSQLSGSSIFNLWGGQDNIPFFSFTPLSPLYLDYDLGNDSNTVTFTNDSNTSNVTFYQWDLNGVTFADTNNSTYDFTETGDFNVTLIMGWDNNTIIDQTSSIISVLSYPQDLDLSFIPLNPSKNESIQFTFDANASPNIKTIGVNFGDSNTSYYDVDGLLPFDFNHTYTTGGAKTVTVTASTDYDVNKSTTTNIPPLFGSFQMNFFNETTKTIMTPDTVTFDGNTLTVIDGTVTVPLAGYATKTYTLTASATDFQTRSWNFDLNQYSDLNYSFALLDSNKSTEVQFKFFDPNLNLLPNALITGMNEGLITGKGKTNSQGLITFYLNTNDSNNYFNILSENDLNYSYTGTTVTVKKPLDEDSGIELIPFKIEVGGLAAQSYSGLTADQTIQIFSDTVKTYEINVDLNTDYYPRNYSIKTQGGEATLTIQPYLIPFIISVFPSINIVDNVTNVPIPNLLIKTYANDLFIESRVTDSTGSAQMSFKIGKTYDLYIYNLDLEELFTATLVPQSSDTLYTIRLNQTDVNATSLDYPSVFISFNPKSHEITTESGSITLTQDVNVWNDTINWVRIVVKRNETILHDVNYSTNIIDSNSFNQTFSTIGWEQNDFVYVTVSLGTNSGAYTVYNNSAHESYLVQTRTTNLFFLMSKARDEELGIIGTTLIAIIITLIILAGLKFHFTLDNSALTFVAVVVLLIFTYLGWIVKIDVLGYELDILYVILIPASLIYLGRKARGT